MHTTAQMRPAPAVVRHCARPGCAALAVASLSYQYASRTAWLDDLLPERDPATYDLCGLHADRVRVPVGWASTDRRGRPADQAAVERLAG